MNNIDWTRSQVLGLNRWQVVDGTFRVLDEEQGKWIARVHTTHLVASGEPEHEFTVIATMGGHIILDKPAVQELAQWCKDQEK